MTDAAPRLAWPLVVEVRRLAASDASAAEICREIGRIAEERTISRPSYEAVRRLVRRERSLRSLPGIADPILEGWLRARSPQSAADEAIRRHERRARERTAIEKERDWRPSGVDASRPKPPK